MPELTREILETELQGFLDRHLGYLSLGRRDDPETRAQWKPIKGKNVSTLTEAAEEARRELVVNFGETTDLVRSTIHRVLGDLLEGRAVRERIAIDLREGDFEEDHRSVSYGGFSESRPGPKSPGSPRHRESQLWDDDGDNY